MLTQPSFLWSASDTVKTSIVKRGKLIHDDIVCQDELPPPIDLATPQAVNVIGCKSPDGVTTLSTCDTEVLQSDARMLYAPCKNCHAQMDLYSRVIQNFGPIGNYRTTDEGGRAIDASVTFTAPPLAPQMVAGSAAVRPAAGVERRHQGLLGPEDHQLRDRQHGPEVQHLRGQRHSHADQRHRHIAVQTGGAGQYLARARGRCEVSSYKFARRSFLRAAGGSAVLLAPLLRSIESRAQGMAAPLRLLIIHHPLGAGPGLTTWRPNADRDDDQLHAAARDRAVRRGRDAAAEVHVHGRRPQPRHLFGPEHARGRHGRDDDGRQRARQRLDPAGLGGRRRVDRSAAARELADARRSDAGQQDACSDRCSSPRTSAPTGTRSRRA